MEVPVQSRGPSRNGDRAHPGRDVTSRTVGSRGEGIVRPNTGSLRHVGSEGGLARMVRTPMSPSGGVGEDVFAVLCSPTNVAPIVEANLHSIFPSEEPQPAATPQSHSHPQVKPPRPQKPSYKSSGNVTTTTSARNVVKAPVKAIPRQPSKQPNRQPQKATIPLFAPTPRPAKQQQKTTGAKKPPSVPSSQFKRGQKRSKSLEREAIAAQRAALDEMVEAVGPDEMEGRGDIEGREERHREGILALVQHNLATNTIPKMMRSTVTRAEPKARQVIELQELEDRASTLHRCHTFGILSVQAAEQHLSTHYDTLIDHTINTTTMGAPTGGGRCVEHNNMVGDVREIPPLQSVVESQWGPSYTTVYGEPLVDKVDDDDTQPMSDDDAPAPPPRRNMVGKSSGAVCSDRLFMDLDSVRLAFERAPTTSFAVAEVAQSTTTPSRFKLPVLPSIAASADSVVTSRPPTEPSPPPRGTSTSTRTLPSYLPSIPVTPSTAKLFPTNPSTKPEPTVSLPALLTRSAHEHKRIRAAFAKEGSSSSHKGTTFKYDYTVAISPRKQPTGTAHHQSYEARLQTALDKLDVAGTTTMDPPTAGYVSLVRSTPLCDEEALRRKILERRVEPKERKLLCDEIGRQMRLALEEESLRRNKDRHVLHCDELRFHSRRIVSEMAVVALFRDVIHKQLEERDELIRILIEREQDIQWRAISGRFAAGLASVQRMRILQGEEPLMRARLEWAWGAEWCPPDINTTPSPTAIHHVFPHSAVEAKFRKRRYVEDTTTQPLPPLGMPFATFLVMQEKDQRRILELFQLQSYRVHLLAHHVNVMVPMSRMPNIVCQNAAARTVQRKFRAVRMGLSGWRHTHRQLGGIIRIQRMQKERVRAKQQTATMLQNAIATA